MSTPASTGSAVLGRAPDVNLYELELPVLRVPLELDVGQTSEPHRLQERQAIFDDLGLPNGDG